VEVEDLRPGLVADLEKVFEPLGDQQRVIGSSSLEQCVCRDGRAESNSICRQCPVELAPYRSSLLVEVCPAGPPDQ